MTDKTVTVILFICILAAVFLLGRCSVEIPDIAEPITTIKIVHDTTYVPQITYRNIRAKQRDQVPDDTLGIGIAIIPDTVVPFVDSTSQVFPSGDTLDVAYVWPQRVFKSLTLRSAPLIETTRTERSTTEITKRQLFGIGVFGGYGFTPNSPAGWVVGFGITVTILPINL